MDNTILISLIDKTEESIEKVSSLLKNISDIEISQTSELLHLKSI